MHTTAIRIKGIVQGVGFRPFLYKRALEMNLEGFVRNDTEGVYMEANFPDGAAEARFLETVREKCPPRARITSVETVRLLLKPFSGFEIKKSTDASSSFILISPDLAVCESCGEEIFSPADRRAGYAFTNCTDCGPRYTIIEDIPYDRFRTSMKTFPMCEDCSREYHDPFSRRFHAQPNACGVCGPRLALTGKGGGALCEQGEEIRVAAKLLRQGKIGAIKGLGGYHLAADANAEETVRRLRKMKNRSAKAFALMAEDLEQIGKLCLFDAVEEQLLRSSGAPVVVMKRRDGAAVAPSVAPGECTLGVMLAYTPLHKLLLHFFRGPLVMTSANFGDEPICFRDEELDKTWRGRVDFVLSHNREIVTRCDDSVTRAAGGKEYPLRIARGYAPLALPLPFSVERPVLACGGELKNTVTFLLGNYGVVSQHLGDLENAEAFDFFCSTVENLKKLLRVENPAVVCDLHPQYLSTKYALNFEPIRIQHHHAHMASCLAENGISADAIGVVMDGLGYGTDGHLWGGEFFEGNMGQVRRGAALRYVPMPAAAVKNIGQMAAALLESSFQGENYMDLPLPCFEKLEDGERRNLVRIVRSAPLRTSSAGRLFDGISAILGFCRTPTYEGEAAVRLEQGALEYFSGSYGFDLEEEGDFSWIDLSRTVRGIVKDFLKGYDPAALARAFHNTLAHMIGAVCGRLRDRSGLNTVVLSGGVFQNMLLLGDTRAGLEKAGFQVVTHRLVPANDGGLSLGQAAAAAMGAGRFQV